MPSKRLIPIAALVALALVPSAAQAAKGPDLAVKKVANGVGGRTFSGGGAQIQAVGGVVTNVGTSASQPSDVAYYVRTTSGARTFLTGRVTTVGLKPGASTGFSLPLTLPAQAGDYRLGACVDLDKNLTDADRTNNCALLTKPFTIALTPIPSTGPSPF